MRMGTLHVQCAWLSRACRPPQDTVLFACISMAGLQQRYSAPVHPIDRRGCHRHIAVAGWRPAKRTLRIAGSAQQPAPQAASPEAGSFVSKLSCTLLSGSLLLAALDPSAAAAATGATTTTANSTSLPALLLPHQAVAASVEATHAPDLHTNGEQQQWWRDPGAWQELRNPAELEAFLKDGSSSGSGMLKAVEFYATWCPACKAAAPEMATTAADPELTASTTFARANVDRVRPVLKQLQVTTIPTVVLFNSEGLPLDSFHASAAAVRAAIQQHASTPATPSTPASQDTAPSSQALLAEAPPTSSSSNSRKSSGATCTQPDIPCSLPSSGGFGDVSVAATGASSSGHAPAAEPSTPAADLAAAKGAFLQAAGPAYGYGGWLDAHYEREVGSRLGPDQHYLDYTGSALYPRSLLTAVFDQLASQAYGNPHSSAAAAATAATSPSSRSEDGMQAAAAAVLQHLNADPAEYQVIFTRSATEALRMVGELFPWSPSSTFAYTRSNHNSVLGIGAYASDAGAQLQLLDAEQVQSWLQQQQRQAMPLEAATPAAAMTGLPPPAVASGLRQASDTAAAADTEEPPTGLTGDGRVAPIKDDILWDAPNPNALLNLRRRPAVASAGAGSSGPSSVWVSSHSRKFQGFPQAAGLSSDGPWSDWAAYPDESQQQHWQQARLASTAAASDLQAPPTDSPPAGADAVAPALPPSPAKQQPQQGPAGPDSSAQRWRLPQDEYRRHRHLFRRIPWDPAMREYQADELRVGTGGGISGVSVLGDVAAAQPWAHPTTSSSSSSPALALQSPGVVPVASTAPQVPAPGSSASSSGSIHLAGAWRDTAQMPAAGAATYHLLAYPAQDNFAGVMYPLDWARQARAASAAGEDRTLVLLDAAAYVPTHGLDLTAHPADFVALSFYKMFGYPTGLGALVVRVDAAPLLDKVYFGGGSVSLATPEGCWHALKCNPADALTDGTPDFLGAAALKKAYDWWDNTLGGMQAVELHTQALTRWTAQELQGLRHSNGAPLVRLYGAHAAPAGSSAAAAALGPNSSQVGQLAQGSILNFSVLRPDGSPFSYNQVEADALAAGLQLRSGCMCNPGACYEALGLTAPEVQSLAGRKEGCGDGVDTLLVQRPVPAAASTTAAPMADAAVPPSVSGVGEGALVEVEVPLGSVRASLGWASRFEDCWALVDFLKTTYLQAA